MEDDFEKRREWFEQLFLSMHYILDENGEPRHAQSMQEFMDWCIDKNGGGLSVQIAEDWVDDARVSTVFLAVDHGHGMEKPRIFETMIFGGPHNHLQQQYATKQQALVGHQMLVAMLRDKGQN